jgi:tetratricopeptide (TPR) repeat protein
LKLKPTHHALWYNRGTIYFEQGKLKEALNDFNQAITLNPSIAAQYNNRGNTYFEMKNFKTALADYDKALSLDPNSLVSGYKSSGLNYLENVLSEFCK